MTDGSAELAGYVATWRTSIDDLLAVLESLDDADWDRPTDLPGWDVRAVAAHVAHLEKLLAGDEEPHADVEPAPHITGPMGLFTEIGVVNRRGAAPAAIIAEIRDAADRREAALAADPPSDPDAPSGAFGGLPWSWRTLLRNRPLDVALHEQDVRRATGRPGNEDGAGQVHSADYLAESLGFVLGKKVGAAPGTSALLLLEGHEPYAFAIGDDGRGRRLPEAPAAPTVTIATDRATFLLLAGGRRGPDDELVAGRVRVEGDAELGAQVLANLGTTP